VRRAIQTALYACLSCTLFANSIRDELTRPIEGCDAFSARAERLIAENYADESAILAECDQLCKETDRIRNCMLRRSTKSLRKKRRARDNSTFGLGMALGASVWLPTKNLATLGNHPGIPIDMYLSYGKFTFAMLMDIRFGRTVSSYLYFNENTGSILSTNEYLGFLFGLDVRYKILDFDRLTFSLLTGLGYDLISHYAVPRRSHLKPTYSESFNLNGGLGIRYFLDEGKLFYLELQGRIHSAGFGTAGTGGTDLSGHYYTVYLLAGFNFEF